MITNTYHFWEDFAQSNLPKLSKAQIVRIEEICERTSDHPYTNDTEPMRAEYKIEDVLQKTPVHLASKVIRDRIVEERRAFEQEIREQFRRRIDRITDEATRRKWLDRQDALCKTNDNVLGWFDSREHRVFICYEAIIEFCEQKGFGIDTILLAVTLHELAHALMSNFCYTDFFGYWLEESLANKVMLSCAKSVWGYGDEMYEIERFVETQPMAYRAGLTLLDAKSSQWQMVQRYKRHINQDFCLEWLDLLLYLVECGGDLDDICELHKLFTRSFSITAHPRNDVYGRYKPLRVPEFHIALADYVANHPDSEMEPDESIFLCNIHKPLVQSGYNLRPACVCQCAKGPWRIKRTPKYVLAMDREMVVGVFVVERWRDVNVIGANGKPQTLKEFDPKNGFGMTDHERKTWKMLTGLKYVKLTDQKLRTICIYEK